MTKKKGFAVLAVLVLTAAFAAVLSVESEAAPTPPVNCSIVLCPAPPPQCSPGQKLGIPAGQCCYKCLPSK